MGLFTTNPVMEMLKSDHKKVQGLFEQFESTDNSRTKARIVDETLRELEVHATLEEKLIYPAIRKKIDQADVMDEALEEHHIAHVLINELKRMKESDPRYDAKFTVLGESIKHHVKEEEGTMFPEAEKADIDWDKLSQEAMKRKHRLMARKSGKGNRARMKNSSSRRHLKKAA